MNAVTLARFLTAAFVLASAARSSAQFNIDFMAAPIAFDSETVTGAPYTAEAITEVVQTLADGNRIVRESRAAISRDGLGRTRREQGLSVIGPVVNSPDDLRQVQITDPQSGTTTLLDMQSRTAHRMPAPRIKLLNGANTVDVSQTFEIALPPDAHIAMPPIEAAGGANGQMIWTSRSAVTGTAAPAAPVPESLGRTFMEGVEVEGTRTTVTIPAGQIGNELPIDIVSERWVSPELKVLVMSRRSDPRFGETTYRLTNITRGEPSPDLFDVPADFTVAEPNGQRDVIIRREIRRN